MDDLFLIAHMALGKARKDVASRFLCPLCAKGNDDCTECQEGWWYILPTTGGRAYPYEIAELTWEPGFGEDTPDDWPDYYGDQRVLPTQDDGKGKDLLARLGLLKKPEPIRRRV